MGKDLPKIVVQSFFLLVVCFGLTACGDPEEDRRIRARVERDMNRCQIMAENQYGGNDEEMKAAFKRCVDAMYVK